MHTDTCFIRYEDGEVKSDGSTDKLAEWWRR